MRTYIWLLQTRRRTYISQSTTMNVFERQAYIWTSQSFCDLQNVSACLHVALNEIVFLAYMQSPDI